MRISIQKCLGGLGLCLWLCFGVLSSKAQRYSFQNFNTENGLIQSQAISLAQDHFNRLWIGTVGGVSVFDGTDFKNYTRSDGLQSSIITAIAFNEKDQAWMGTPEGVSFFDGFNFKNYKLSTRAEENHVVSIEIDNQKKVWVQTTLALFRFDGQKFVPQQLPNTLSSIATDQNKILYASYINKGIFKNVGGQWLLCNSPKEQIIRLFTSQYSSSVYALTNQGFAILKDSVLQPLFQKIPPQMQFTAMSRLLVDHLGHFWITDINGVWRYDGKEFLHFLSTNGFTDEQALSLFEDKSGNIWFGTNGTGVYRFSYSPFRLFDNASYPFARNVYAIHPEQDGRLMLITLYNGIFSFNPKSYGAKKKNLPQINQTIAAFTQGSISYFATFTQIWKVQQGKAQALKRSDSALLDVTSWLQKNDSVWFATSTALYRIAGDSVHRQFLLAGNKKLAKDASGQVFLGSNVQGVAHLDLPSGRTTPIPALQQVRVQCMIIQDQKVVIGTDDKGLVVYDLRTKKRMDIDRSKGLSCDFVYNLLFDKEGHLWVGTGCGIDRIRLSNTGFTRKSFGKAEGLSGAESNENASFQDDSGNLWFGTTKGLYLYDASIEKQKTIVPKVLITDIKLFSKELPITAKDSLLPYLKIPVNPEFQHNQNNLSFSYKAVSLSGSSGITYRYKLEGADPNFVETKQTSVVYPSLPPGDYVFKVYASDENGQWHDNAAEYPFQIKAVFYQTLWFKFLVGGLLTTLLGLVIFWWSNRKEDRRRWEARLREQEQSKIRQKTAEDFHDEVGNKITRINLLTMMAEKKASSLPEVTKLLSQIRHNTQSLYLGTKDIIWSLQDESNYLKEALLRIQQNTTNMLEGTGIKLHFNEEFTIKDDVKMPLDYSRHLILIFKEAVNNAIKYAEAKNLYLNFFEDIDNSLVLELRDDGRGFSMDQVEKGNGLKNIQNRAEKLRGKISISSDLGQGTSMRLRLFKYSFKKNID